MRITSSFAAALAAGAGLTLLAQQAPPPRRADQPPVTFKVEINYVELDAIVTDAQGRSVGDLTKEDFQVFEEGKPQTIAAFARVDLPIERPDPPLSRAAAIEPDVRSNHDEFNGRVLVLVLDDLHTAAARSARLKAAARQFIERYVGANDMVAIVSTGGRSQSSQEFTSSRARLLAAVDTFVGQKLRSATLEQLDSLRALGSARDPSEMQRSSQARNTLDTLRGLADYLAGIRGRRKAIIWFGEGIDYDVTNVFEARDADVVRYAMQEAIAAATRGNVSVYGIDPRGLGAGLDDVIDIQGLPDPTSNLSTRAIEDEVRRAHDSLRVLSEETGGFAIVNQNDASTGFTRIIQENSSYYMLGYYASNDKRDGRFRAIDVRVARPGMKVRARRGYVAAKARGSSPQTAPLDTQASPALRDALMSPIPSTGLGLAVFAAPFAGKRPKASLALVLEIDPGRLKFTQQGATFNDDLEIVSVAIDAKGKIQAGGRDTIPLRLGARSHDMVSRNGMRVTRRLDLLPGRYQLRIGAREANGGAVGSLAYDVDIPDFSKAPLQISGIALSSASATRIVTANPDPAFKDVLPEAPTAIREFQQSDTLSLFAEVYDNLASTPHRVAVKTTVLADDGSVVSTASDERRSEELGGTTGAYLHSRTFALKAFAPGRYVLRLEAQSLMSNGGTAMRELEFRVR